MSAGLVVRICWSTVIVVTVLRAVLAAMIPLTGDEAYYWEWSRRLAAGYIDHPPAVAFAIAMFSWIGHTPFAIRIAFVLCGAAAAIFTGLAARELGGDRVSAAGAGLAVSLAPLFNVAFGIATPDGPYALAWAASLYCAASAFRRNAIEWYAALGIALGAALLARFFGFALMAGVVAAAFAPQYGRARRHGLWLSLCVAAALYAPFLVWNAHHGWASFVFALHGRHPAGEISASRPFVLFGENALAFSPGLWIAACIAVCSRREPLVLWTALPLSVVLFVLSLHERVEAYWFFGPFVSACAGLSPRAIRSAWVWAPAALLCCIVFAAGIAPVQIYAVLERAGVHLSDAGPFEMFTYPRLSMEVRRDAKARNAIVMTDGYGFSSLLDFYAGVPPVVIGYDRQGAEAKRWFTDRDAAQTGLFLDKVPLETRPDFDRRMRAACGAVSAGPEFRFGFRVYYSTWCERMRAGAIATLRWEDAAG